MSRPSVSSKGFLIFVRRVSVLAPVLNLTISLWTPRTHARTNRLWEKKFGRNANHVKLRQKDERPTRPVRSRPASSSASAHSAFAPARTAPAARSGETPAATETDLRPKCAKRGWGGAAVGERQQDQGPDAGWGGRARGGGGAASGPSSASATAHTTSDRRAERADRAPRPPARKPSAPASSTSAQTQTQALHPSWIAKQKLKERESALSKPAGTKIVFD